ncbi:hypothetical protein EOL96_08340, partial [Candidatus Saccharibacteria bacterium]|nr:hypothetical protein [Candidatus Saccharibacteria bacterium]
DSPNYTPAASTRAAYGMDRVIEGITIHHWGDPNQNPQFDNIVNYLCRANGNTSAHYVCEAGRVACIVAPHDTAWHSGSTWGNARTIGIELNPRASDADYDTAAELVADIRSAYGDVPIYWHSYFVATACPGRWNPERLDQLSYTKYSHDIEWGQGGTKPEHLPKPVEAPVPLPVVETPQPATPEQQTPSPTSQDPTGAPLPDTGIPVADKPDYGKENNTLLKTILALVQSILDKLTNIFKG